MATKEKRNARGIASTGSAAALLNVKSLAPAGGLKFDGSALHSSGKDPVTNHVAVGPEKELNDQARQARVSDSHSQISDPTTSEGTRAETHATAGKMSAVGLGDAVKLVAFSDGGHSPSGSFGSNTPISLIDSLRAPGTAGGLSSKDQSATDTAGTNAHSSSDAAATGVSGGNFESLTVGSGTATANVTDTVTPATVDLTASTVNEGSGANYVFTATLSNASEGVTTIHTDQGDISIADGATTGTLTIASGNGEDVYSDASSLTAHITGVSGGNFEHLVVGSGTATAQVNDTITDATVDLTASTVTEGAGASYVFTATLSDASQGVTTIHTDQGDISIADGATTGTLTIASGNGEDVYSDASSLTAHITGVSGGNFEHLVVGSGTATAQVNDTITDATVDLTASTVTEGAGASYVFTATLSDASQGVTTIHTDQGDISIADGATTGTLTIASGNGEDVYSDASSLTAHITGVSGGNFEHLVVGSGTATAQVNDTITDATVDLTASTVTEGAGASYVFTATLSDASQGVTTIHTDQGDISIADGATTGTLTIASGNGEDVYTDASSLTAHITGVSGGNFESLSVGSGTATAQVTDTVTPATVDLTASTVNEGSGASYVFTATLSNASEGVTTIHTDQGDISIADGATTGTLTIASGNGEDVYTDASSLTAHITGVSGGNFESLSVGTGTATANVTDTVTPATVDLTASTVNEGSGASYVFTATLSNASEGVTTIHTDQGDISIADGATTGTLTIASGNGEDVYTDASSLTAHITGVSGGNFELLSVGTGTATAQVTDTVTPATVDLTASTVTEGAGASYVFTATLSDASQGVTTIHTDQGDISIADGATTGTLTIASGNGEDVYTRRLQPDGSHHRRLRRQLRAPGGRQRHGDGAGQ